MEISEVRIKLMENPEDRLRAFCSVTFDNCFVIRDLKIIEGHNGPFVAMPSRKLSTHCRNCHSKNHLRARFCNHCGKRISAERVDTDSQGRVKLYADIAHPINAECREQIQNRVIGEFRDELERARQPGYVSRYDDDYNEIHPPRHLSQADTAEMRAAHEDTREMIQGPHCPPRDRSVESPAGDPDTVGSGEDSADRNPDSGGPFGAGLV